MIPRGARRLLAAAFATVLAVGLRPSAQGATTLRPAAAQRAAVPQRIVSLVPATTEMLFAIGAGARVVGVSNYDRYPPEVEQIAKVGGLVDPNVERLLSLRPDLVLVYDSQSELKGQLDRAGIAYYNYIHRGLPDVAATMRDLGQRIGAAAGGEQAAARLEGDLAAIRGKVAGRVRPRTLLVFGREPGALRQINASGGQGFLHDILELAGGADVLADVSRQSVMMSTEMVLARAPQVIVELHYGESLRPQDEPRERRVWNALPSVPAVRNNKVFLLTGNEFVVPGPRLTLAAERLARALHPDAF